jgi:hypothetical protein
MAGSNLRARLREVEVELDMVQGQLQAKQNLADEVRSHLEAKAAALQAELKGLREQQETGN